MKRFDIWMEGYAATGEHGTAQLIGQSEGETFEEAVINFRYPEDIVREFDGKVIVQKGDSLSLDKNPDGTYRKWDGHPTIWACRLFDNEQDARKSFG